MNIRAKLRELAHEYPQPLVAAQLQDLERIAFQIELVRGTNLSMCDLGGGVCMFSVGCAAMGFQRVVLIDDFSDPVNQAIGNDAFTAHRKYGVEVIKRDIVANGLEGFENCFDLITSIDSMEHWHHSPKKLLYQAVRALKPNGTLMIGVPNCFNLRKRIAWPLGIGSWSSMADWYEQPNFRGHVREPSVADLKYIAADLGLRDVRIIGRNWAGTTSDRPLVRALAKAVDYPLRLMPSLCSDLYLVARR